MQNTDFSNKLLKLSQYALVIYAFCQPISLVLQNFGFILALLFALMSCRWLNELKNLLRDHYIKVLLLFSSLLFIGIFYGDSDFSWKLRVFKKEIAIIGIVFLLPIVGNRRDFLLRTLKAYVYGCLLVFIIAVLGNLHWLPKLAIFNHEAPYYVFFKIYGAMFVAFGAFVCAFLWYESCSKQQKWFWAIVFILLSYNVLFQSFSRTGYIQYVVLMFLFIIQHMLTRKKILLAMGFGLVIVLALFFSHSAMTGLKRIHTNFVLSEQNDFNNSTGIRLQYMKDSYILWKKRPILGYGTGGYREADAKIHGMRAGGGISTLALPQVSPENTYAHILVEQGIIGLILLLLLFFLQLKKAYQHKDSVRGKIAMGFILSMILGSLSQSLLLDESSRLFYILFSVILFSPMILNHVTTQKLE